MRGLLLLAFISCCLTAVAVSSSATVSSLPQRIAAPSHPVCTIPVYEFSRMKIKDMEKISGKKFSFKEKVALRLLQWKLKTQPHYPADPDRLRKMGTLSLLLGVVSLLLLFLPYGAIASLCLAIVGLVLGIKAAKSKNNITAILGIIFNSLTLALLILAIAIVASWRWN